MQPCKLEIAGSNRNPAQGSLALCLKLADCHECFNMPWFALHVFISGMYSDCNTCIYSYRYVTLESCWKLRPEERPHFKQLVSNVTLL